MKLTILTLFPEYFESFASTSIIKRALEQKKVELELINFREYTKDRHHNVDDTPCGGGAGMLLSVQPIADCLKAIRTKDSYVVMLSPQGKCFNQQIAREMVKSYSHIILLCGHYEGFDERVRSYVDCELSIGDFVLTGGEAAAIVVCDALIRLMDGVIQEESHLDDSFENGLLEYPQYTRPIEYEGQKVPEVLLSGHHENIRKWRLKQSLKRTMLKRGDLIEKRELSKEEKQLMKELEEE